MTRQHRDRDPLVTALGWKAATLASLCALGLIVTLTIDESATAITFGCALVAGPLTLLYIVTRLIDDWLD